MKIPVALTTIDVHNRDFVRSLVLKRCPSSTPPAVSLRKFHSLPFTPLRFHPPHLQILVALITIDVHNRDIVESLVLKRCTSKSDFTWQMQLRYEYDQEAESVVVRQVQAR